MATVFKILTRNSLVSSSIPIIISSPKVELEVYKNKKIKTVIFI